jgi:hypothetical protein
MDERGRVLEVQVKQAGARSSWIWEAFKMPGAVFHQLYRLWCVRGRSDEYVGTLVNAYLAQGGCAWGVPGGRVYVDVGTLHGYREAIRLLSAQSPPIAAAAAGRDGPADGARRRPNGAIRSAHVSDVSHVSAPTPAQHRTRRPETPRRPRPASPAPHRKGGGGAKPHGGVK